MRIGGVAPGSVQACSRPDVRCRVLPGWVRSSGKSSDRSAGVTGEGKAGVG